MVQSLALVVLSKKVAWTSTAALSVLALTIDPMLFAGAAALVIGAIGAAWVTIINALGAVKKELLEKQIELLTKQGELSTKSDVIGGHVDGMTTAATAKRAADELTILDQRQQIADLKETAAVLAQSKADVAVVAPIAATVDLRTKTP